MRFKLSFTQDTEGNWEWTLARSADEFQTIDWVTIGQSTEKFMYPTHAMEDALIAKVNYLDNLEY
jgi:hypothetical protein